MISACYRELRGYKYELVEPFEYLTLIQGHDAQTPYLKLEASGKLQIQRKYAWDGPSGPTIDTLNFMRGSLVHDALYQLIRLQKIPSSCKAQADQVLRDICKQDGMSKFRSWYVYQGVKHFSGDAAKPGTDKPEQIVCAPAAAPAPPMVEPAL